MEPLRISFDFDETLDRPDVQSYARELASRGFEIWICTARLPEKDAPSIHWNEDLYKVADSLGIPRSRIIFTAYRDKWVPLLENKIAMHLDDSYEEIEMIMDTEDVRGVLVDRNWRERAEEEEEEILKK